MCTHVPRRSMWRKKKKLPPPLPTRSLSLSACSSSQSRRLSRRTRLGELKGTAGKMSTYMYMYMCILTPHPPTHPHPRMSLGIVLAVRSTDRQSSRCLCGGCHGFLSSTSSGSHFTTLCGEVKSTISSPSLCSEFLHCSVLPKSAPYIRDKLENFVEAAPHLWGGH